MIELEETLEHIVDRHGVAAVLEGLAAVCHAKAEHIRTNWQDAVTARAWDATGKIIDKARARVQTTI